MTTRSSVLHISKLICTTILISFLVAALLPGAAVLADRSTGLHNFPADAALRLNIVSASLQQEEPNRLELFYIEAPQLRVNERAINVYLPPDYFTSEKSYPVIYLHDGNMVFSTNGGHDSRYNLVLDHLFDAGETDGIIAVGIAASENRWDEYSPWVNENMDIWGGYNSAQVEGGEGDAYLDFIVNNLKPVIDSRYRTLPDRENTAIGGFSMGGLISLYAGLKYPEVFSKVMAQSTAVWFAEADRGWHLNNQLIRHIKHQNVPDNVKFYLDIGTNEWADEPMPLTDALGRPFTYPFIWVDGTDAVFNTLETHGVPKENLLLLVEEGGEHEPSAWQGRFMDAMLWLWDGPEIVAEPNLVTVIPPKKAVIVQTPTAQKGLEHTPTTAPEIQVVGVEREPVSMVLLFIGIGFVIASALLFFWLTRFNRSKNR